MADATEIADVRLNTNEPDTTGYTDEVIGAYIDALGVAGASAKVWEQKAAKFSDLVNVSEAGASHSFSDLSRAAELRAKYWSDQATGGTPASHPVVRVIERST